MKIGKQNSVKAKEVSLTIIYSYRICQPFLDVHKSFEFLKFHDFPEYFLFVFFQNILRFLSQFREQYTKLNNIILSVFKFLCSATKIHLFYFPKFSLKASVLDDGTVFKYNLLVCITIYLQNPILFILWKHVSNFFIDFEIFSSFLCKYQQSKFKNVSLVSPKTSTSEDQREDLYYIS